MQHPNKQSNRVIIFYSVNKQLAIQCQHKTQHTPLEAWNAFKGLPFWCVVAENCWGRERVCPEDTLTKFNCTPTPTMAVRIIAWQFGSSLSNMQVFTSANRSEHVITLQCGDSHYFIVDCKPEFGNFTITCYDLMDPDSAIDKTQLNIPG